MEEKKRQEAQKANEATEKEVKEKQANMTRKRSEAVMNKNRKTDMTARSDLEKNRMSIVKKNLNLSSKEEFSILKRDRPELIGILQDLNKVVKGLKEIDKNRVEAIKRKFSDCAKDCTLFLDANRTYGALLAFYLRLTVK